MLKMRMTLNNRTDRAAASPCLYPGTRRRRCQGHHLGGVAGAAPGEDIKRVEHLEGTDHVRDQDEQHGRVEQREADAPELAPSAGPVDLGRLVDGPRYACSPA